MMEQLHVNAIDRKQRTSSDVYQNNKTKNGTNRSKSWKLVIFSDVIGIMMAHLKQQLPSASRFLSRLPNKTQQRVPLPLIFFINPIPNLFTVFAVMRINFASAAVLALGAQSVAASTWFGKAGK
jgi:hypothetical protein